MANSLPDYIVPQNQWIRLDQFVGITNTEDIQFINKGVIDIVVYFGSIPPQTSSTDGLVIRAARRSQSGESSKIYLKGSDINRTWIKVLSSRDYGLISLRNFTRQLGAIKRYFTELYAAGGMYYQFANNIIAPIQFIIDVDILVPSISSISTASMIFGNSANTNNSAWIDSNGRVVIRDNSGSTKVSDLPISEGVFHKISFIKQAGSISIRLDGNEIEPPSSFGSLVFNRLGARRSLSLSFNGYIANFKMWDGIIREDLSLIVDSPIDEADGVSVIKNKANPSNNLTRVNQPASATELYTLNKSTTPDQWENATKTKIIPIYGTS